MKYYLDCEFDGHNGPLLSMALVCDDGLSIHIETNRTASEPWVVSNVVPLMGRHDATFRVDNCPLNMVGLQLHAFIGDDQKPVIVADSPVDIGRFCRAISTGPDGGWASVDFPTMTFEVHNVDCYPTDLPGAIQHNAWWDAKALQHKFSKSEPGEGSRPGSGLRPVTGAARADAAPPLSAEDWLMDSTWTDVPNPPKVTI